MQATLIPAAGYSTLVSSLPKHRQDAWAVIASLRDQALRSLSVPAALAVFENRFHLSLEALVALFQQGRLATELHW